MLSTKREKAAFWGATSTVMAFGCTVGMVFSGPVGWVILGTAAGVSSGVAVSSVVQACDDKQKEFSYSAVVRDGVVSAIPLGVALPIANGALVLLRQEGQTETDSSSSESNRRIAN